MIRTVLIVAMLLGFTALLCYLPSAQAAANDIYWQTNAGGCVPIDDSMQSDTYNIATNGATVEPKGTGSVIVDLTCPVKLKDYPPDYATLKVHFQDADTTANNVIIAYLNRYDQDTGSLSVLCSKTTPNTASSNPDSAVSGSCGILDPEEYFYWVRLYMKRYGSSGSALKVFGAEIFETN